MGPLPDLLLKTGFPLGEMPCPWHWASSMLDFPLPVAILATDHLLPLEGLEGKGLPPSLPLRGLAIAEPHRKSARKLQ